MGLSWLGRGAGSDRHFGCQGQQEAAHGGSCALHSLGVPMGSIKEAENAGKDW